MKFILFSFILILNLPSQLLSNNKFEKFSAKYNQSIAKIRYNYSFNFRNIPTYYESTGFAIDDGSLIVTSLKNLPKAEAITVYNNTDTLPIPAWVVAKDTNSNICILKTDDSHFVPINLDSKPVKQAQDIVLIGWLADRLKTNNYIITEGIVSSSLKDTIVQTSAPLNYGMEGGAALDLEGNLVGMVTGKDKSDYEKTGFFLQTKFISNLLDTLNSDNYQLDTNETDYQYHKDLGAYKKFAEASTYLYKDLNPITFRELDEGLDNFLKLNEKSELFEKNQRTYSNIAYYYLLKTYINSIELNGEDEKELSRNYSKFLNKSYDVADSTYKEYLTDYTISSNIFFKTNKQDDEKFRFSDFYSDYFRRSWNYFVEQYSDRSNRMEDFQNWIRYGRTPDKLDDALGVFKNQRRDNKFQEIGRAESSGEFLLHGPITIMNGTDLVSDPYQNFKNLVPYSNYFLVGYAASGYGVRVGFQNYQRLIPLNYVAATIDSEEDLEAIQDEQSLIIGGTFWRYFEINYFFTSSDFYYSNYIDFSVVYNRPNEIDGLTDFYILGNVSRLLGVDNRLDSQGRPYAIDKTTNMLGIGGGIRIFRNFYLRSIFSVNEENSQMYRLNFALEAYY